ncbi:threonine ammonia-lyase IlvA [Anaerobacillus isosaccharinicus]|uniref:L-threonine dehydratase n=1 Tax=Anaerobacillus isosaccharinicus TaxID=1532552 RepID=A0A7S7RAE2_9BACI|nr:threonine ammonia-lyase IlvA [Anaerobacillus isosaccharinicus]MBA5586962.1 threonine ammonia-lyase IlvA [Anaerobacillus isosaccharinicus]QOY34834.1 threonine ammonia-lyase IlvA [Anaerobacillus isosaccharinicus]
MNKIVKIEDIVIAHHSLKDVVIHTPLQYNDVLSERYNCNVYVKREDLQVVRSFKIRGAYFLIQSLLKEEREAGVVCASAGNHAQGVAYACKHLKIFGKIFMPKTTPRQKVTQVKRFGGDFVEVVLCGDTFDDAFLEAMEFCTVNEKIFIHPFDDQRIIAGQGTVGLEIMDDMDEPIDYLFMSIGGGGLTSGVGTYIKGVSPGTKLIGVEPKGAPAMKASLDKGEVVTLKKIDKFVDGAAVKKVGELPFSLCLNLLDDIVIVPEGKVCTTILELYNENAIVAEPAGALPISALQFYQEEIKGKNVVCVISGGNNDIGRMQEIKERSLIYEGLVHHFIINFPQRAGALREFLDEVLGPDDDIIRFEYTKKNNKENGPALVGIELKRSEDYEALLNRMTEHEIEFIEVNKDENLFNLLV